MADRFEIIQQFFTRMQCHHCHAYLEPAGIELIREERGVFIVNIACLQCEHHMGVAMVGMEESLLSVNKPDIELTTTDIERLSAYDPIDEDDVLDAHHFFSALGGDWQKYLPSAS